MVLLASWLVGMSDQPSTWSKICLVIIKKIIITPVTVSKDEWDTKEDAGKSMKNALYVLRFAKRHLSG